MNWSISDRFVYNKLNVLNQTLLSLVSLLVSIRDGHIKGMEFLMDFESIGRVGKREENSFLFKWLDSDWNSFQEMDLKFVRGEMMKMMATLREIFAWEIINQLSRLSFFSEFMCETGQKISIIEIFLIVSYFFLSLAKMDHLQAHQLTKTSMTRALILTWYDH